MERFHPITYAEIDLSALIHNYLLLKEQAGDSDVICVVKADAYGHGAEQCAGALYEAGARRFAVANVYEALGLSFLPKDAKVLILGHSSPEDVPLLLSHGITQNLYSFEYADSLLSHIPDGEKLKVHLKIETGMNRLGFSARPEDREALIDGLTRLYKTGKFSFDGAFTHFACADSPENPMTKRQYALYRETVDEIERKVCPLPCRHACNSAGIYEIPEAKEDAVRGGILLYGIMPSDEVDYPGFRPVMRLVSHITHLHTVHKGETVGYGASYTADEDTEIATVAIGYADGLERACAPCGAYIGGVRVPILGRICMDQCMLRVSGMDVKVGDEVELFGKARSVAQFAADCHTIPYETMCLVGKRVMRVYCPRTGE